MPAAAKKPFQPDLFGAANAEDELGPPGLGYWPEVLTSKAEAELAVKIAELPFQPFDFHGYLGNRRTVSFGFRYDYGRRTVEDAQPIPDYFLELRDQMAALAGRPPEEFVQGLVNEYAPGAGIGWHRDRPQFGLVMGLSLLSPCVMRFRRKNGTTWDRLSTPLAPRSAYRLSGPARSEWEHSITPMEVLRYSVTFRTWARDDPHP
jgi:alkylated DNA repair dioxygenase AlkB